MVFSPSGEHYYYVGRRDKQMVVMYDGEPGPRARDLGTIAPAFMEGERFVYSVKKGNQEILCIDGVAEKPRERVRGLSFSADGSRYSYFAGTPFRTPTDGGRGSKKDEDTRYLWTLVVDGKKADGTKSYPFAPAEPIFSPDGKRIAFIAGREKRAFLVLDGKEGTSYDFIGRDSLVFTPDSQHVAYCAAIADQRYLVVDDVRVENQYSGFMTTDSILCRDADSLAVRASRRGVWLLLHVELM